MRASALLVLLACVTLAPLARAQDAGVPLAMQLPFAGSEARLDAARGEVFVVVHGAADERRGPLSAQRLSARRLAEARARALLHRYVDAATARSALTPSVVDALHAAIDRDARVSATRPRVDGSADVRVSIPVARLREITGTMRGLPWST